MASQITALPSYLSAYVVPGLYYAELPESLMVPNGSPLWSSKWKDDYISRSAIQSLQKDGHVQIESGRTHLNHQEIAKIWGRTLNLRTKTSLDADINVEHTFARQCHEKACKIAASFFQDSSPTVWTPNDFETFFKTVHKAMLDPDLDKDQMPGEYRSQFMIIYSQTNGLGSIGFHDYVNKNSHLIPKLKQFFTECQEHGDFSARLETTALFDDSTKQILRTSIDNVISGRNIPIKMNQYFDFVQKVLSDDTLQLPMKLALIHNEFVGIHPFADGSGRVARLFVNTLLKYVFHEQPIFFDSRREYATAVNEGFKDIRVLANYFQQRMETLNKQRAEAEASGIDPDTYCEILPILSKIQASPIPLPKADLVKYFPYLTS